MFPSESGRTYRGRKLGIILVVRAPGYFSSVENGMLASSWQANSKRSHTILAAKGASEVTRRFCERGVVLRQLALVFRPLQNQDSELLFDVVDEDI